VYTWLINIFAKSGGFMKAKERKAIKIIMAAAIAAIVGTAFIVVSCEQSAGSTAGLSLPGLSRSVLADQAQEVLLSYTVLDNIYENGSLKYISGEEDATATALGTVNDYSESGVDVSSIPDPVVFTYTSGADVRALVGKIQSKYLQPSTCAYSLYNTTAASTWGDPLGKDITLLYDGIPIPAANPHGIAQVGNYIYLIDWETQYIYIIGVDELVGKSGPYELQTPPFNVADKVGDFTPINWNNTTVKAEKGQAIIALNDRNGNNYLYALYLVSDNSDPLPNYDPSKLVKMSVNTNDGSLTYTQGDVVVDLSPNATEIIPVNNGDGTGGITLLVPGIGGAQGYTPNTGYSYICGISAFDTFEPDYLLFTDNDSNLDIHRRKEVSTHPPRSLAYFKAKEADLF
jgi:hypothetical protein